MANFSNPTSPNRELLPPQFSFKTLDERYELLGTIGKGRFAKVKKAIDLSSKKEVAIKILRQKGKDVADQRMMLMSFFKEIQILARCNHPNIVKMLDASFRGTMTKEICN